MCMLMMPMYDVAPAVAAVVTVWIDFPYNVFGVLLIQRTVCIDARMYENAVPIDIHQREPLYPIQMGRRHDCHVGLIAFLLSVRDQRRAAAIREPPIDIRQRAARLPHDVF